MSGDIAPCSRCYPRTALERILCVETDSGRQTSDCNCFDATAAEIWISQCFCQERHRRQLAALLVEERSNPPNLGTSPGAPHGLPFTYLFILSFGNTGVSELYVLLHTFQQINNVLFQLFELYRLMKLYTKFAWQSDVEAISQKYSDVRIIPIDNTLWKFKCPLV